MTMLRITRCTRLNSIIKINYRSISCTRRNQLPGYWGHLKEFRELEHELGSELPSEEAYAKFLEDLMKKKESEKMHREERRKRLEKLEQGSLIANAGDSAEDEEYRQIYSQYQQLSSDYQDFKRFEEEFDMQKEFEKDGESPEEMKNQLMNELKSWRKQLKDLQHGKVPDNVNGFPENNTDSWNFDAVFKNKSPEEILYMGFRLITDEMFQKENPDLLRHLIEAGRQLKIPEEKIVALYNKSEAIPDFDEFELEKLKAAKREAERQEERNDFEKKTSNDVFPVFEYDDLPVLGHLQLREHRIQRDYNRIAAYELPQLTQYVKEYTPRSQTNKVLRFKYARFLGEDSLTNSKVVLTFNPDDLGLDEKQLHKIKLLAGPRYDSTKNEIKIACQRFSKQSENKDWLDETVRDLLEAARDKTDTFEDVPLNLNHIEARTKRMDKKFPNHEFPEEWKIPRPEKQKDFEEKLLDFVRQKTLENTAV